MNLSRPLHLLILTAGLLTVPCRAANGMDLANDNLDFDLLGKLPRKSPK